ncbi:Na+/H+ antiporter subunit A [Corynebacterium sp. sy017]|uniref:Na+/H+ antiporter subunit A n=1 Tax=unclassified Corynebacterium TaxID=2624378 RepID=UPI001185B2DF|nr:Na+/H+ antiporter subunit A [Corynebacterium sp. SY003]MBP3088458.1 Na+/H+ antiporter subunit A [Corynebacterium sp. sy017]TSD91767.1 Na+/H+ antiporter subunit A [Corynebacterium sp. SY003]
MLFLFFALAGASILAPFLIARLGQKAFGLLALVPACGFIWVLTLFTSGTFDAGGSLGAHYNWMSNAHLDLSFRLDALSGFFSLIILGIGALVLFYCWGYFDSAPIRLRAFAGNMSAFTLAMYGLVISDNLLLLYVFWEITSVLSFLLVGYYGERASSRRAATQALMITTLGGLAMLVGIIVLGRQTNVWTLSALTGAELEGTHHISYALVFILIGALSKSAIAPAHFWLPGAMAAPTPVSAYLHSAAMVKAGIYLIARFAPEVHFSSAWHVVIMPLGILSMVMAGWMSLRQKDLKLVLAYGTLSQLGFITTIIGIGSQETLFAGLALTFAHSLFKATLFMVVGAIDHTTGTRDCRELSGLGKKQPLLAGIALIATASMAGIIPTYGFVAKETVLNTIMHEQLLHGMPAKMVLAGIIIGSIMTVAYSLHFLHGAFATKDTTHSSGGGIAPKVAQMHTLHTRLWLPPALLSALCLVFGVAPDLIGSLIRVHISTLFPENTHMPHLALWHGWTVALFISIGIITAGCAIFWQRKTVAKLYFSEPALGDANAAYDTILAFLRTISLRLTASTQRGSLVFNLGIIFVVLCIMPMAALLIGERTIIRMDAWTTPLQAVAAGIMVIMAIAAATVHNRLSGLLFVGATGYGVAFIFATYGAPDLALTQLLVETITVVVFMLVLRRFPAETQWRSHPKTIRFRAWLSIAVGIAVTIFSTYAINARTLDSIATTIPDLAYEIGHGANAVNVLLVDIRAWDTFGEISVLVIAAIGVASLVYRTRTFRRESRRPTLSTTGRRWLASAKSDTARNRSLLVNVTTRLLFPTIMILSLYFFFAGHNAPGGGFAGGLVASLGIVLRYLAGGKAELEETFPIDAARVLGVGLLLSAISAIAPLFFGYPLLTSLYYPVHIPHIGTASLSSVLVFDAGVYLIVIGLVVAILGSLGVQLDEDEHMRKQRARDRARHLRKKLHERKEMEVPSGR